MTGVLSVELLLAGFSSGPLAPSSAISAVLATCSTPAGKLLFTRTANWTVPVWPTATLPTWNEYWPPPRSTQPGVLPAELNAAFAGTDSLSTTPVAFCVPVFV